MTVPARNTDPSLPPEIAERMTAAGLSPKLATLMQIIEDFARQQADAREKPEAARVAEPERGLPLKGLLPSHVSYRVGLQAAERGVLGAFKIGGRWFCTQAEMDRWLAATGRCR
jgi:hypothetical protein